MCVGSELGPWGGCWFPLDGRVSGTGGSRGALKNFLFFK